VGASPGKVLPEERGGRLNLFILWVSCNHQENGPSVTTWAAPKALSRVEKARL
jgi:hypothetical protein